MNWCSEEFKQGIREQMKDAGVPEALQQERLDAVIDQTHDAICATRAALELGHLKAAQLEGGNDLRRMIYAIAQSPEFEKMAVIRAESCTDSDGNKGSYVLYDSSGSKRLGCHASREAAEAQERAIQASKHASEEKPAASMSSGKGSAGRQALAERFYDGDEFDHSACVAAIRDEGFADDPDAYCRSLAKLVGRGHEATTGPREGKQPGE